MLPFIVKQELSVWIRAIWACFLLRHELPLLPYWTKRERGKGVYSRYTVERCGSYITRPRAAPNLECWSQNQYICVRIAAETFRSSMPNHAPLC